jgi:hypothetical protein
MITVVIRESNRSVNHGAKDLIGAWTLVAFVT